MDENKEENKLPPNAKYIAAFAGVTLAGLLTYFYLKNKNIQNLKENLPKLDEKKTISTNTSKSVEVISNTINSNETKPPSKSSSFNNTNEYSPYSIDKSAINKIKKIGEGNYGKVYEGTCKGVKVAIKEIEIPMDNSTENNNNIKDFYHEVSILARIRNPYILSIMGTNVDPPKYMIITELLHQSLHQFIEDKSQFNKVNMYDKLIMGLKIAKGLCWLHSQDPIILHNDLKPANILLTRELEPKICDFGFSFMKNKQSKVLTSDVRGTALYMAPEVLTNSLFDETADIYSYTLILWQIITGNQIFDDIVNFNQLKAKHYHGQRPDVSNVPSPLKELIERGWHKVASMRPPAKLIIEQLNDIIVELTIPSNNDEAVQFWKEYCSGEVTVNWEDFKKKLSRFLGLPFNEKTQQQLQHVQQFLNIDSEILLNKFGELVQCFGPFNSSGKFLAELSDTLSQPWFHGDLTSSSATSLLSEKEDGTFLVRKSGQAGYYTISFVQKKKIFHQRVKRVYDVVSTKFILEGINKTIESPSLIDFIQKITPSFGFKNSCPSSNSVVQEDLYSKTVEDEDDF
eukprot:TRINITY_DN3470_c0_g1_i2.p1 TRINITY_DN3470_c0_g1~~TRINITY_DN3470_c0_g1_i2.p1  ORF type:complete len:571 (-),score=154.03 TRINITY_DN3470_c0_g1_i2:45-1757(-)